MDAIDLRQQTTLVTGASAGIGAALSRALAARGSDLVLVARRESRLRALADELRGDHGVHVEVVAADLAAPRPGRTLADEVARRGVRVTSLVNNAGFGLDGPFTAEDPDHLQQMLAVDVAAVVDVTRAFLPDLVAAGTGALVNITSMAAYQPAPGMAAYAASKAFVLSLTEALWWETRGTGVRTLAFAPNLTRTEFFDEIGTESYRGRYQTPDEVAAALVRALGRRDPGPSTTARRGDAVLVAAARLLGRRTALRVMGRLSGDRILTASA